MDWDWVEQVKNRSRLALNPFYFKNEVERVREQTIPKQGGFKDGKTRSELVSFSFLSQSTYTHEQLR